MDKVKTLKKLVEQIEVEKDLLHLAIMAMQQEKAHESLLITATHRLNNLSYMSVMAPKLEKLYKKESKETIIK